MAKGMSVVVVDTTPQDIHDFFKTNHIQDTAYTLWPMLAYEGNIPKHLIVIDCDVLDDRAMSLFYLRFNITSVLCTDE